MQSVINQFYKVSDNDIKKWVSSKLKTKFQKVLIDLTNKTVNLEMLAIFILFANFADVERKLDDIFEVLTDTKILDVIELMQQTEVAIIEGDMFKLAYDIIAQVKSWYACKHMPILPKRENY